MPRNAMDVWTGEGFWLVVVALPETLFLTLQATGWDRFFHNDLRDVFHKLLELEVDDGMMRLNVR